MSRAVHRGLWDEHMKAEAKHMSEVQSASTPCGKCGCIVMYRGDLCLFCDAAEEILEEALSSYGVPTSAIRSVDVESDDTCGCSTDDISALPTITICDVKLTGLPDEQMVNDAVIRAIMKECFCE
jgi:hypothetical protein